MPIEEIPVMERQMGGCDVKIFFSPNLVDGVIERVQSILSHAYDERVQNDLKEITASK